LKFEKYRHFKTSIPICIGIGFKALLRI